MNELRKYQALLLAQQQLHVNMRVHIENIESTYIMRIEEYPDSLNIVLRYHEPLRITSDWCVQVICSYEYNVICPGVYDDNLSTNMRAFLQQYFPQQLDQGGDIVVIELTRYGRGNMNDVVIRCDFDDTQDSGWYSEIHFGESIVGITIGVDSCIDIIDRAMCKFNLKPIFLD